MHSLKRRMVVQVAKTLKSVATSKFRIFRADMEAAGSNLSLSDRFDSRVSDRRSFQSLSLPLLNAPLHERSKNRHGHGLRFAYGNLVQLVGRLLVGELSSLAAGGLVDSHIVQVPSHCGPGLQRIIHTRSAS
mmetsp:Transcript_23665/g.51210  ORF Transcript_23665/g.51210 Transcript_23665/m.51210 type:complete len:132 (-) Transcript_23665:394-789(-)